MPGKPPFAVYDLRSLTQDEIEELRIALHERLIMYRSATTGHDEDSVELARRRGRVEALLARVSHMRHDKSCITRGPAARAAYKASVNAAASGMKNGKAEAAAVEEQEDLEEEAG